MPNVANKAMVTIFAILFGAIVFVAISALWPLWRQGLALVAGVALLIVLVSSIKRRRFSILQLVTFVAANAVLVFVATAPYFEFTSDRETEIVVTVTAENGVAIPNAHVAVTDNIVDKGRTVIVAGETDSAGRVVLRTKLDTSTKRSLVGESERYHLDAFCLVVDAGGFQRITAVLADAAQRPVHDTSISVAVEMIPETTPEQKVRIP